MQVTSGAPANGPFMAVTSGSPVLDVSESECNAITPTTTQSWSAVIPRGVFDTVMVMFIITLVHQLPSSQLWKQRVRMHPKNPTTTRQGTS